MHKTVATSFGNDDQVRRFSLINFLSLSRFNTLKANLVGVGDPAAIRRASYKVRPMSVSLSKISKGLSCVMMPCLISIAILSIVGVSAQSAHAVSNAVKQACKSDYFAFCSSHSVGSRGLRKCMRSAGSKLSKRCVKALISAGEITRSDIARHARRSH